MVSLERGFSDHVPLLLHDKKLDYGLQPFKFFHSWINYPGFNEFVKECFLADGYKSPVAFNDKLKFLKVSIKNWVKTKRVELKSGVRAIHEEIEVIEKRMDENPVREVDRQARLVLLQERNEIQRLGAQDIVQKAKIKWNVEGDENSKFFHGMLKNRRNKQTIQGISLNGVWVTERGIVKNAFKEWYGCKFARPAPLLRPLRCRAVSLISEALFEN
ncbi:uncharacterized protein [Rutidosis leptorrhynchoides]|uniref:uncharacterized protein n=1 Tax=Rutidosis leptorrhynchoides TaxID=125765 RepID=UPI003A992272